MLKQRTDFFETISGEALFEAFRNQFSAVEEERGYILQMTSMLHVEVLLCVVPQR